MKAKFLIVLAFIVAVANLVSGDFERKQRSIAESFFQEGVFHFNQQEYTAATNALLRALSNDPSYYKARYWLGRAYYHSGYVKNTLTEWEYILNSIGNDPLLKNKISRLLYRIVGNNDLETKTNYLPTRNLSKTLDFDIINPVSIYNDKSNLYWVTGYSSNNVVIFDKNGKKIDSINAGESNFNHPYDVVVNSKGEIFISDFGNDRVHKFSKDRKFIMSFGQSGLNKQEFYGPQGLALDKYDNIYVVDKGNHRVQKFDSNGQFLILFGEKGAGNHQLMNPTDLAIIKDQIYVTDTGNKRIQVFDQNGNWINQLDGGHFLEPKGIKAISSNELIVADKQKGIMSITLNPLTFTVIKAIDKDQDSSIPIPPENKIKSPVDVAIDENHFLYIVDITKKVIPVFAPEKMKYNNIDLSILQTYTPDYSDQNVINTVISLFSDRGRATPKISHRIAVHDQTGKPIFGLHKENFIVYENGIAHEAMVQPESKLKKNLSIAIINERSKAMGKHKKQLEKVTREILSALSSKDQVEVVNFNQDHWVAQDFIQNELSPLYAVLEDRLKEGKKFGDAFYKGINDLFKDFNHKGAILLITSGEIDENSFMPYGYDVCLNYAKNNMIPVYIISFSDGPMKDELLDLATMTGGHYFDAYTSNDLNKLVKMMYDLKHSVYYVHYKSKLIPNRLSKWREVKIEVKLKDLFGQDRAGYFLY